MKINSPPQVRIPTEIHNEIFSSCFKLNELRVLMLICRFQYGFNQERMKKFYAKTQEELGVYGLYKSDISEIIKNLIDNKIVIRGEGIVEGEKFITFEINTNLAEWKSQSNGNFQKVSFKELDSRHVAIKDSKLVNN